MFIGQGLDFNKEMFSVFVSVNLSIDQSIDIIMMMMMKKIIFQLHYIEIQTMNIVLVCMCVCGMTQTLV